MTYDHAHIRVGSQDVTIERIGGPGRDGELLVATVHHAWRLRRPQTGLVLRYKSRSSSGRVSMNLLLGRN